MHACIFVLHAGCKKLAIVVNDSVKLYLDDGCEIVEDAEVTDPDIVNGATLTIKEEASLNLMMLKYDDLFPRKIPCEIQQS